MCERQCEGHANTKKTKDHHLVDVEAKKKRPKVSLAVNDLKRKQLSALLGEEKCATQIERMVGKNTLRNKKLRLCETKVSSVKAELSAHQQHVDMEIEGKFAQVC